MKILPEKSGSTDKLLELVALLGLLACWVIPLSFYASLPDTIPTHFDISGQTNGYSTRAGIWGLPVLITFVYFVLTLAGKLPPNNNGIYPASERIYRAIVRLLQLLKLEIAVLTAVTIYLIMLLATNKLMQMPRVMLPVFLGCIFSTIAFYFWQISRRQQL